MENESIFKKIKELSIENFTRYFYPYMLSGDAIQENYKKEGEDTDESVENEG